MNPTRCPCNSSMADDLSIESVLADHDVRLSLTMTIKLPLDEAPLATFTMQRTARSLAELEEAKNSLREEVQKATHSLVPADATPEQTTQYMEVLTRHRGLELVIAKVPPHLSSKWVECKAPPPNGQNLN